MQKIDRLGLTSPESASAVLSAGFDRPIDVLPVSHEQMDVAFEGVRLNNSTLVRSESRSGVVFANSAPVEGFSFSIAQWGHVGIDDETLSQGMVLALDSRLSTRAEFAPCTIFDGIKVGTSAMLGAFEDMTQRTWSRRPSFERFLDPRLSPILSGLINTIHLGAANSVLLQNPHAERSLEDALFRLLLGAQGQMPDSAPAISNREVRRAMAYMEANAILPITVTDVARETGVSLRALQLSFARIAGISPHAFLRQQRLSGARRDLLEKHGLSVAGVARKWGFGSPSHFGRAYEDLFGELPSQTLRRH